MIGPPDLIKAATNLQSHSTSNVANVSQQAALAALTGDLTAVAEMRAAFDRRRRRMHALLNQIDGDLVEVHLADASAPTLIRENDKAPALYVLMPMRV